MRRLVVVVLSALMAVMAGCASSGKMGAAQPMGQSMGQTPGQYPNSGDYAP